MNHTSEVLDRGTTFRALRSPSNFGGRGAPWHYASHGNASWREEDHDGDVLLLGRGHAGLATSMNAEI